MNFLRKASVFSLSVVSVVGSNCGVCSSSVPLSDAEKEGLRNEWEKIEGLLDICKVIFPALSKDSFEAILSEVSNRMQLFRNLYDECQEELEKLTTANVAEKEVLKGKLYGDKDFLENFLFAWYNLFEGLKTEFNEIYSVDPNIEYDGSQEV